MHRLSSVTQFFSPFLPSSSMTPREIHGLFHASLPFLHPFFFSSQPLICPSAHFTHPFIPYIDIPPPIHPLSSSSALFCPSSSTLLSSFLHPILPCFSSSSTVSPTLASLFPSHPPSLNSFCTKPDQGRVRVNYFPASLEPHFFTLFQFRWWVKIKCENKRCLAIIPYINLRRNLFRIERLKRNERKFVSVEMHSEDLEIIIKFPHLGTKP